MTPSFLARLLGTPKLAKIEDDRQKLKAEISEIERSLAAETANAATAAEAVADALYNANTLGKTVELARAETAEALRQRAEAAALDLSARLGPLARRKAEIDQGLAEEAERERLRRLPQLRRAAERHAIDADEAAARCGESLRKLEAAIREVRELVDTSEAHRALSVGGILQDTRVSLPRWFLRDDPEASARPLANNFLPLDVYPLHAEAQRPLVSRIQRRLDPFARIFATEAEAEEARLRIDPTGETIHAVRDDALRCFRLVEGRVRGVSLAELERQPGDEPATLPPSATTPETPGHE